VFSGIPANMPQELHPGRRRPLRRVFRLALPEADIYPVIRDFIGEFEKTGAIPVN
jgi:hypothetical protein